MEYIEHKAVWFPCAVRIAGLRLRPPTLGQLRLLEAVNSPFIAGGRADSDDCAIALWILATPWRRARRRLERPGWMAARIAWMQWRRVRDAGGCARAIEGFVGRALWVPERYEREGAGAPAFAPASGLAARLALRAARLGLAALAHGRRGAWDCVWDIPVDAVLAYGTAAAETEGSEYQTRGEEESLLEQQLDAHADTGDDQPGIDQHPQKVQHDLHGGDSVAGPDGSVQRTREAPHG